MEKTAAQNLHASSAERKSPLPRIAALAILFACPMPAAWGVIDYGKPDPLHLYYNAGEIPGETIDIRTRQVTWEITDLSVPGNGGLDLIVARSYRGDTARPGFGGWQVSVPRITFETDPTGSLGFACASPTVHSVYYPIEEVAKQRDQEWHA